MTLAVRRFAGSTLDSQRQHGRTRQVRPYGKPSYRSGNQSHNFCTFLPALFCLTGFYNLFSFVAPASTVTFIPIFPSARYGNTKVPSYY